MPATWVSLAILIIFIAPGFLADFLLGNWVPRAKRDSTEIVLTSLIFTMLSFIPISLLIIPRWVEADKQGYRTYAQANAIELTLVAVIALAVLPTVEAILVGNLARWTRFVVWIERWLGIRIRLSPKAWDYLWGQNRNFYAIVTFADDSRVAGGWSRQSWASGFPNEEDIYFEVVYSLTEDGKLGAMVPYSAGMLLKRADIRSIELIDYAAWEANNEQERQGADAAAEAADTTDAPSPG